MGFWDWIFGKSKEAAAPPRPLALPSVPPRLPPAPPPRELVAPTPPPAPVKPPPPRYSIDAAIALMRALPMDEDPELVLRVVRKTLRSTGVSVEELIATARTREDALSDSIADDRRTIEQLEREIADRKEHIETVAKQLAETTSVRERLQEAVQTESKVGMLLPPEEIARLHAEGAAARGPLAFNSRIPPPPGGAAGIVSPPSIAPKPSAPPAPKASLPPLPSKPMTPQPPRVAASHAPKEEEQDEKVDATANIATPATPDIDSLFETDDPKPSEPTVRKAIDVSNGVAEAEKGS